MAGHSKWANIRIRKGSVDARRAVTFTRLAKNITIALREGGGANLELNSKLKTAIEQARDENMPRENIDRLVLGWEAKKDNLTQMVLEGFAPGGIPVIITCESDSKNRTLSEMRFIFKKAGGSLGESGCVDFMFEHLGEIKLVTEPSSELQLELIDYGACDIVGRLVYTKPHDYYEVLKKLENDKVVEIESSGLIYRPKDIVKSEDHMLIQFLEELEEHPDVIEVFAGVSYE